MQKLLVSASPHIKSTDDVPKIMWTVFAALIPAACAGVYFFGLKALILILVSIAVSIASEALWLKLSKKDVKQALDGSAAVTGLLLALVISSNCRWYVAVIGAIFAIIVVKQFFGGIGCNIWNPALMGRAFVMAAFASQMAGGWALPYDWARSADAATGPTPLEIVKKELWKQPEAAKPAADNAGKSASALKENAEKKSAPKPVFGDPPAPAPISSLWIGETGGCIGETSAILIILGGLFLIWRGIVNWRVPFFYIATTVLLMLIFPYKYIEGKPVALPYDTLEYILFIMGSGGLMLGAFFMATDMVTSPITNKGLIIFAVGCGVITAVIRLVGGYPEGVCYSILLMNTATPLIDRFTQPKKFGEKKNA